MRPDPRSTSRLSPWSRREFFGAGLLAGVASLLRSVPASATTLRKRLFEDSIYTRLLGVRPHLPGHGYQTIYGGSRIPPEVVRAMAEANDHFVDMHELFQAAGKRLAEATGAEAGLVTSGSFSALLLGAAGCLTLGDADRIEALPHPTWPKRECLMLKEHRFSYDRAFRAAGMTLVEVESREAFMAAISDRTAMIATLASVERRLDRPADLMMPQEVIDVARKAGVPVLIDNAAELPPEENLTKWSRAGADLVVISGGKGLRAPQSSGILVGRADLIEAARLNAFPYTAIGRGMKVGREEIVGLITALDRFVSLDHDAYRQEWTRIARFVAGELQGIRGLTARYVAGPETVLGYDAVELTWDEQVIPLDRDQVRQKLKEGEPRLVFDGRTFITRNLENGEEILVARRLRQFFSEEAPRGTSSAGA